MKYEITEAKLLDFVALAELHNIDFARITYGCGAIELVDENIVDVDTSQFEDPDFHHDKILKVYKFKDFYLNRKYTEYHQHYVLAVIGKAYLMYEMREKITIWVCFTEEECRRQGYITELLKRLKTSYPKAEITVDTNNESLAKICRKLEISLFRS